MIEQNCYIFRRRARDVQEWITFFRQWSVHARRAGWGGQGRGETKTGADTGVCPQARAAEGGRQEAPVDAQRQEAPVSQGNALWLLAIPLLLLLLLLTTCRRNLVYLSYVL